MRSVRRAVRSSFSSVGVGVAVRRRYVARQRILRRPAAHPVPRRDRVAVRHNENGPPRNESGAARETEMVRSSARWNERQTGVTFSAAGPLAPSTMSNSTSAPSASVRKPSAWIAEWWTKQSLLPSAGVMKPNPFWSLNHFTVPLVRIVRSIGCCSRSHDETYFPTYMCWCAESPARAATTLGRDPTRQWAEGRPVLQGVDVNGSVTVASRGPGRPPDGRRSLVVGGRLEQYVDRTSGDQFHLVRSA